jgi:hypothetical protein
MKTPHPWRGVAKGEYVGDNAPKPAWLLVVIVYYLSSYHPNRAYRGRS